MFDIEETVYKRLGKTIEEATRDWKERIETLVEKAKKSIKHPHFYYACVNPETGEITYKKKKWYKWLSGKRIVLIKISKIEAPDLPTYRKYN